ncbi:HLA class II histocompatibility antigen, DQ beta 2 chain-like isoform X2 [Dunckerocampus dactyliophorus]|uniref:HLA class II histocompatibility antigen, DQ beta 2 chain-like isoform X2 n=1 Tax=Dunckerocampus dactyliophorus TaxID=161453 RepID=UPI002404F0AF|nr:HLA class II histocompatibility antigen, DQ beta 2 chain-like isoform X2 [Dunckerocampus dactyliophorus]
MHIVFQMCLCLMFSQADAFFSSGVLHCEGTASDAVLLGEILYNKMLLMQYNSTVGKYIGYTEKARKIAEILNTDYYLDQQKHNLQKCKTYFRILHDALEQTVEPIVRLRLDEAADEHPSTFVCSVYNFFPKNIMLTWLRNGEKVTSEVMSTESLPNGNWLYQRHSHLQYTPTRGDTISCMVEHASLQEPKIYDWGRHLVSTNGDSPPTS